jgi:lipopolysaccharide transport system ATP-binding protein
MSKPAIRVEGLGKEYMIGGRERASTSFREALLDAMASPLRHVFGSRRSSEAENRFWALKDIDLEVEPGEVVGIIGRNGAGKSTLLKILSRITAPTKGRVEIDGRVSSLLEVGTGFHLELTGRENIRLNGAILGMSRAEIRRKFDDIVAFSGVEKFIDTPVKHYSSGMQVRLAFAVAAHLEPEILVVDEVLAVGDAEFQKKCLGKMGEIAERDGRTVLFVSHNMGAVKDLCPRCILLGDGQVVRDGASSKVIAEYMDARPLPGETSRVDAGGKETILIGAEVAGEGINGNSVFWSKDFALKFYYRAAQIAGLELILIVSDHHGRRVFVSGLKLPNEKDRYAGIHVATAKIPGRLLAPGRYSVTVELSQPNVFLHDIVHDIIFFTIIGDNHEHYRFGGGNADLGVVTFDIAWTVERDKQRTLAESPAAVDRVSG